MAAASNSSKLFSHNLLSKDPDGWKVEEIEILDPKESEKKCICKKRSRYICQVLNYSTNQQVQLSLECAEKFNEDDPISKSLKQLSGIFLGCMIILKNPSALTSNALIEYASKKHVFTKFNASFYDDCIDSESLAEQKQKYKEDLNQLLIAMISSAKFAYTRLLDKKTNIAAPRLIRYAFKKGVLTKIEKRKYLKMWKRMNIPFTKPNSISFMQKEELINLNERILTELKTDLYYSDDFQPLTKIFPLASSSSSSSKSSSEDSLAGKRKERE